MPRSQRPLTAAVSPAQALIPGSIVLLKHTWDHIMAAHPEVELWQLQDTLVDPDYIAASTTVPGDFVFICEGNTNEYGDPLVVPVRTLPDGSNIVTTAYYDENYGRHQPILWRRSDG